MKYLQQSFEPSASVVKLSSMSFQLSRAHFVAGSPQLNFQSNLCTEASWRKAGQWTQKNKHLCQYECVTSVHWKDVDIISLGPRGNTVIVTDFQYRRWTKCCIMDFKPLWMRKCRDERRDWLKEKEKKVRDSKGISERGEENNVIGVCMGVGVGQCKQILKSYLPPSDFFWRLNLYR